LQCWRVKCLFLVDGLPTFNPSTSTIGLEGETRVAVISGFGTDEPVTEVFAVARLLPQVTFYMTGDSKRAAVRLLAHKPENVILTGFLKDSDYIGLLKNVHGLVDLTKEPNILTCGMYEALAVGKPVVVSDWPQIKRYFTRGFIYVNNSPAEIAAGIKKLLNEQGKLTTEVIAMRSELVTRRQPKFEELVTLLQS
jgi:glycosyltransferase involved in cell wall biosynthesis